MKHFFLFTILACILVSCGKNEKNEDRLIVGTNPGYYPYETISRNGSLIGFDIDVTYEIGNRLGKKIIFKEFEFDALILSLKKDKIDLIISGMSITPTRLKEIFMVPYQGEVVKNLYLVFWEEIPAEISSFNDLKNNRNTSVVVQMGTFQEHYLLLNQDINYKSLENNSEIIMDIKHGKSLAALLEPNIAKVLKKKFPQLRLLNVTLEEKDWVLGMGIGIKKENQKLIEDVSRAVEELKKDGIIKKLEKDWFE